MSKIPFNPRDWLPAPSKETAQKGLSAPVYNRVQDSSDDIERITREIEQRGVDIAPTYGEWCNLGFAFAEGLGEIGRSYYHRLSSLHHDYNQQVTDKQYTACLNGHGQGITIATFYYMAKKAGVSVGGNNHSVYGQGQNGKMAKRLNGKTEAAETPNAASSEATPQGGNYQNTILPFYQNDDGTEKMVKMEESHIEKT